MKVDEAPEKIILSADRETGTLHDEWVIKDLTDNVKIEYVRKDTFIEKACEYINKELPITDLSPSNMLDITFKVFDKECKKVFIESFRKYMEGE